MENSKQAGVTRIKKLLLLHSWAWGPSELASQNALLGQENMSVVGGQQAATSKQGPLSLRGTQPHMAHLTL